MVPEYGRGGRTGAHGARAPLAGRAPRARHVRRLAGAGRPARQRPALLRRHPPRLLPGLAARVRAVARRVGARTDHPGPPARARRPADLRAAARRPVAAGHLRRAGARRLDHRASSRTPRTSRSSLARRPRRDQRAARQLGIKVDLASQVADLPARRVPIGRRAGARHRARQRSGSSATCSSSCSCRSIMVPRPATASLRVRRAARAAAVRGRGPALRAERVAVVRRVPARPGDHGRDVRPALAGRAWAWSSGCRTRR